jgi:flagellar hook-associated protein 3 FlgL
MPDLAGAAPDERPTPGEIPDAVSGDSNGPDTPPAEMGTYPMTVRHEIASVGSEFFGVQSVQTQNPSNGLTMKQDLSGVEDAAVAEVLMRLVAQQVAYDAALTATARAITPSLTDFLR